MLAPLRHHWKWMLLASLLVAATRLVTLQGWMRPVRIVGGSMAYGLVGDHHRIRCSSCGIRLLFDASQTPAWDPFICCFNCAAFHPRDAGRLETHRGPRVLVDRLGRWQPRRGDVVVVRDPRRADRLAVKRIVGQPCERIALHDGDIWVNGRRFQKSLSQFWAVAVLVHDDRFRRSARGNVDVRWRTESPSHGWSTRAEGYGFHPRPAESGIEPRTTARWNWLSYHHVRSFAGPARGTEAAVTDHYGFNQGVSRELNEVTDLVLDFRLRLAPSSRVVLQAHDGRQRLQARIDPAGTVSLWNEGKRIGRAAYEAQPGWQHVTWGVFDRQVVLSVDHRLVFRSSYAEAEQPFQPTSRPMAIGAAGGPVALHDLRLFRDLYYWQNHGTGVTELATDEYFLLGDNLAVSDDSRSWPDPGLSRDHIVGRVVLPD